MDARGSNKLLEISALLVLYSDERCKKSFFVDKGILYEIQDNIPDSIQFKRAFTFMINKGKGSSKHYIRIGKGFVKTDIYEYKRTVNGRMSAYETKARNFIIVYNYPYYEDKHYIKVFSRKTGKKGFFINEQIPFKSFKDLKLLLRNSTRTLEYNKGEGLQDER